MNFNKVTLEQVSQVATAAASSQVKGVGRRDGGKPEGEGKGGCFNQWLNVHRNRS